MQESQLCTAPSFQAVSLFSEQSNEFVKYMCNQSSNLDPGLPNDSRCHSRFLRKMSNSSLDLVMEDYLDCRSSPSTKVEISLQRLQMITAHGPSSALQ